MRSIMQTRRQDERKYMYSHYKRYNRLWGDNGYDYGPKLNTIS